MSLIKCDICELVIDTDAEPDCWRKSVFDPFPDIALCTTCRERRDASQDRARARMAACPGDYELDEDIDGPSRYERSRDVKRGIT